MTLLSLNRLAPRQSAEMIIRVNGGKALPKEIFQQIVDRTDGVPLFIEELTKSVLESGIVTKDGDDGYTVTRPVVPLAIPMTLHASLLAHSIDLRPFKRSRRLAQRLDGGSRTSLSAPSRQCRSHNSKMPWYSSSAPN